MTCPQILELGDSDSDPVIMCNCYSGLEVTMMITKPDNVFLYVCQECYSLHESSTKSNPIDVPIDKSVNVHVDLNNGSMLTVVTDNSSISKSTNSMCSQKYSYLSGVTFENIYGHSYRPKDSDDEIRKLLLSTSSLGQSYV